MFGRKVQDLSAFTGYAGGKRVGKGGHVCYHNPEGMADYGEMGHAEVVSLALPAVAIEPVFDVYFDSVCVHGNRIDTQDWGSEYRSLVGFPGGVASALGRAF